MKQHVTRLVAATGLVLMASVVTGTASARADEVGYEYKDGVLWIQAGVDSSTADPTVRACTGDRHNSPNYFVCYVNV